MLEQTKKSFRKQTWRPACLACCGIAVLALITGCSTTKKIDRSALPDQDIPPLQTEAHPILPQADISTGAPLPSVSGATPSLLDNLDTPSLSAPRTEADESLPEAGYHGPLAYYMAKCDVYWKMNWLRKQVTSGNVPEKMALFLARTRKENHATRQDGNAQVADQALDHLDAGLLHWRVLQVLENAHIHSASIPWMAGPASVDRFIAEGGFGFGARSSVSSPSSYAVPQEEDEDATGSLAPAHHAQAPLSQVQERAISVARQYAASYHEAPEYLMQREWQEAIVKINQLRDQLHLKGRAENMDSDTASIDPELLRHAAHISGTAGGVADQDLVGNTPQGKEFLRALHEPSDPFGDQTDH